MKLPDWFFPAYWQQRHDHELQREVEALQAWQQWPLDQRQADNSSTLRELCQQITRQAQVKTSLDNATRVQLRQQRSALRRQMIQETPLLKLPFKQLSQLLPFITAFFFLSGYWVVTRYLGELGINTARFFSLWDYISSSMNALRSLFISLLISFFFMAIGFRRIKLRIVQHLLGIHQARTMLLWLIFSGLVINDIYLFVIADTSRIQTMLIVTSLFFLMALLPGFSWRFSQPAKSLFITSFIVIYAIFIDNAIRGSVAFSKSTWANDEPFYTLTVEGHTNEYRLLAGNTQYLFTQDRNLNVHVFPLQAITRISVINPAHTVDSVQPESTKNGNEAKK